jgi:ferritin-like metal-binding protein YciE
MIGTALTLDNLDALLVMQLKDLMSAEEQLIKALPKMADAASSAQLKNAFTTHLEETREHKRRLERAFGMLGHAAESETCEAMQGLISEGSEIINAEGDPEVKDAALIAAAQRVEHYEIAGYGCARAFALKLGHKQVAELLEQTLDEEGNADETLTRIAENWINAAAAQA